MIEKILSIRLEQILKNEIEEVKGKLGGVTPFKAIELIKCIDHCFVAQSYIYPKNSIYYQNNLTIYQKYTTGWYDLLKISLEGLTSPALITPIATSKAGIQWANDLFGHMGNVGNVKRIIALAETTDFVSCKFERDVFKFKVQTDDAGIEFLEAQEQWKMGQEHFNKQSIPISNELTKIMRGNSYSADKVTVTYNPNEYVDNHFIAAGRAYAKAAVSFDSFPGESIFNGIPYSLYQEVLTCLISRCYKHLQYCLQFQIKTGHQILNPWNIYTQVVNKNSLINQVSAYTKICLEQVETILNVITLDANKLVAVNFQPAFAPPPIIKTGGNSLALSMMGHLSNPFIYFNKCLDKLFSNDRSVAGSVREKAFKEELYSVFENNLIKIKHEVRLKEGGKELTDIDAVIFDRQHQILCLFQLKWMDDWGTDMYRRRNMIANYKKKVDKWIEMVDYYIDKQGRDKLYNILQINGIDGQAKIYKIILGRHFSLSSGYQLPEGTVALNWARLINLLHKNPNFQSSLLALINHLKDNPLTRSLDKHRISPLTIPLGIYSVHLSSGGDTL
ncbi:MAG: hypothetical protein AAGC65_05255 [Mucilaginibacter sp.]|uniref:hypothetical protein n=1 Tax=Mucilaginibacter sp. TaxID=1882438 RepID=UPI0031A67063